MSIITGTSRHKEVLPGREPPGPQHLMDEAFTEVSAQLGTDHTASTL